ncbi:hypothetical protein ACX0G7_02260 [Flavitalea antarctica]
MKSIVVLIVVIHLVLFVFAQEKMPGALPLPSWGLSITPNLLKRTSIDHRGEKYELGSSPQIGGEVLIKYRYAFLPNYRLIFAGGVNWISYDFDYNISKDLFIPPTGVDISSNQAPSRHSDVFHLRGQLEVERQFFRTKKKSVSMALGASLLYSPQNNESAREVIVYPGGSSVTFLYRNQTNNNNDRPWMNFHISAGPEWLVGRRQTLQLHGKLNFSPVKFITGTYYVEVGNEPVQIGQYGVTGSYIGMSLTYIFNRSTPEL